MSRHPAVRFIVVAQGRAGTTMLMERLGTHPGIRVELELLRPGYFPRLTGWRRMAARLWPRRYVYKGQDPMPLLDRLLWGERFAHWPAAGFKILEYQWMLLSEETRAALMAIPDVKIIYLSRDDLLAHCVSLERAYAHGFLHRRHGQPSRDVPAVALTPETFVEFVHKRKVARAYFRSLFAHLPYLEVSFERLVAAPEEENARMLDFLGLPQHPLRDLLVPNSATPLQERITDYAAFAEALRGTPHARFLPDALPAAKAG